jgi:hypothetical protein
VTQQTRTRIWRNLVHRNAETIAIDEVAIPDVYEVLGMFEINGREIKNVLRLAVCCARGEAETRKRELGKTEADGKADLKHLVKLLSIKYAEPRFENARKKLEALLAQE